MTGPSAETPPAAELLLLLDSRSPAGAHSHSGGMEAAVTAGFVGEPADVERFCRARLVTAGRVAAGFAAAAARGWSAGWDAGQWQRLDAELSARTPSPAARQASRRLGSGLRRLLRATHPDVDLDGRWSRCPAPAPHHPLVLGAGCALAGGGPRTAARAAAQSTVAVGASAAVRLLGLDPYAVHAIQHRLTPVVDEVADDAARPGAGLPAASTPAMELLADVHAQRKDRLFAS
jgi:urease accessory protein